MHHLVGAADVADRGHADAVGRRAVVDGGLDHLTVVLGHAVHVPASAAGQVVVFVGEVFVLHFSVAGKAAGGGDHVIRVDDILGSVRAHRVHAGHPAGFVGDQGGGLGLQHVLAALHGVVAHELVKVGLHDGLVHHEAVAVVAADQVGIGQALHRRAEHKAVVDQVVHRVAGGFHHHVDGPFLGVAFGVFHPGSLQGRGIHILFAVVLLHERLGVDGHGRRGGHRGAAVLGGLVDHQDINLGGVAFIGVIQGIHNAVARHDAGAAHTDHQHLGVDGLGGSALGRHGVERAHSGTVAAGRGDGLHQAVFRRRLDGAAGNGGAGDGVHLHGLVLDHRGNQVLNGGVQDNRGIPVVAHFDGSDLSAFDDRLHVHLVVHGEAPCLGLIGAVGNLQLRGAFAGRLGHDFRHGGLHGAGGQGRAGHAVNGGGPGFLHLFSQRLKRRAADARGFTVAGDRNIGDFAAIDDDLNLHRTAEALLFRTVGTVGQRAFRAGHTGQDRQNEDCGNQDCQHSLHTVFPL